jgi:hypothetical protein
VHRDNAPDAGDCRSPALHHTCVLAGTARECRGVPPASRQEVFYALSFFQVGRRPPPAPACPVGAYPQGATRTQTVGRVPTKREVKMKTKMFITVLLAIVLVSCSQAATPTLICLDCDQDEKITPQELRDVFTKMREEVKIIAKSQPSVAAPLEEKIASLENEVVGPGSNQIDLYVEMQKMGQLEREINSAITLINAEQAAKDQPARNLKIGGGIVAVILFLAGFFLVLQKRSENPKRHLRKTSDISEKVVKGSRQVESQEGIPEPTGKTISQKKTSNIKKGQSVQKVVGIMVCPNCKMKVLPKFDGTCPSCQSKIM